MKSKGTILSLVWLNPITSVIEPLRVTRGVASDAIGVAKVRLYAPGEEKLTPVTLFPATVKSDSVTVALTISVSKPTRIVVEFSVLAKSNMGLVFVTLKFVKFCKRFPEESIILPLVLV